MQNLTRITQSAAGVVTIDGNVVVTGDFDSNGSLTLDDPIVFSDVTDATSATTGSVKIAGGLGVAKKIFVGDSINVADAKPVIQGMNTFPKCTLTSLTSAATVTYSAAQVVNGFISDAVSAACAATLPAPANIVAAIPGCVVGTSFEFILKNAASGAFTITLTASGASTIVGTATVDQNNTRRFKAIVTNITGSSEAVVFYSLGSAAH